MSSAVTGLKNYDYVRSRNSHQNISLHTDQIFSCGFHQKIISTGNASKHFLEILNKTWKGFHRSCRSSPPLDSIEDQNYDNSD